MRSIENVGCVLLVSAIPGPLPSPASRTLVCPSVDSICPRYSWLTTWTSAGAALGVIESSPVLYNLFLLEKVRTALSFPSERREGVQWIRRRGAGFTGSDSNPFSKSDSRPFRQDWQSLGLMLRDSMLVKVGSQVQSPYGYQILEKANFLGEAMPRYGKSAPSSRPVWA
jgi:hypothetical protein